MKLLLVAPSLDAGGAERQLVALANGLTGESHEVTVAVFASANGALAPELDPAVPLVLLGPGRVTAPVRLAGAIRRTRPDIVYSLLAPTNVVAALAKPASRGARLVWGVRHSALDPRAFGAALRTAERVAPRLARFADLVIANSEAGRRHHEATGYPAEKLVVIPNGIDTERFRPDAGSRALMRKQIDIGPGQRAVGMVARVDPTKDHRGFFAAAARIVAERDVVVVCVGGGEAPELGAVESDARRALGSHLRWLGQTDDVFSVYNALDVCCLASWTEGFPNVVGEAMATGVPCVVTDVGDAAAIVGDTGVVVPPGSVDAMADGIRTLLDILDGEQTLADAARRRIETTYPLSLLVRRTADTLSGLL
jgi:glycosyltransferase involved in cell wall biosynthesis